MTWIESVLKRDLPTTDLFETLKSGVVLREMVRGFCIHNGVHQFLQVANSFVQR